MSHQGIDEKADVVHAEQRQNSSLQLNDGEKGSVHDSETGEADRVEFVKAERRLVRKLDRGILPFAVLLYLSAYLDRGNMANARLQGLQEQALEGKDTNYSIALSCFFIAYILLGVPGTLTAKAFNPSTTIGVGCIVWSLAATCQGAVTNPAGMYVCRLFIGIGESLFGQAMGFHLSLWYTKSDLAKRVGLFISAGALAGAFGGLIAFGVSSIENSSIAQWRMLFLIEGLPSVFLGIATLFFLPSRPETSKYMTEAERTVCLTRLNRTAGIESESGIDWKGVRRCATDWKVYMLSVMFSCMNLTLASVSGFLPTIIKGFGYTAARAQLFTVPPYAVALVFMLCLTTYSDWKQARGIPIMSVFMIGIMGWVILMVVPAANASQAQYSVRYFGCCCIVTAGYTNIPLIIAWQSANNPNESQRAASLGFLTTIGQILSLVASFIFPTPEAPGFTKGCILNISFQALGLIIALSMTSYYRYENKRRDKIEGKPELGTYLETYKLFDKAPGFRFVS